MKVERHHIQLTEQIATLCRSSACLYNKANYFLRQRFFAGEKLYSITELVNAVHEEPSFRQLHNTKTAKQTLRKLLQDWSNFFKSLKAYKKDKKGFKRSPKPPKYKSKLAQVIFYKETVRRSPLRDGYIQPTNDCFRIRTCQNSFQQVVITPKRYGCMIDVIYQKTNPSEQTKGDGVCSIDFGLNNLCAITSDKHDPLLVNGRVLKSINQWFNKKPSKHNSRKREFRIANYFHHVSKFIVKNCVKNGISKIVFGVNRGMKQRSRMGKKNNQNFQYLPLFKLRQMIAYKALEKGIEVIETEEAYTSKASFHDRDKIPPYARGQKLVFSGQRTRRGMYKTTSGITLNADANASANIMRKVIHNFDILERVDRSLAARPVLINPLKEFRSDYSDQAELGLIKQTR